MKIIKLLFGHQHYPNICCQANETLEKKILKKTRNLKNNPNNSFSDFWATKKFQEKRDRILDFFEHSSINFFFLLNFLKKYFSEIRTCLSFCTFQHLLKSNERFIDNIRIMLDFDSNNLIVAFCNKTFLFCEKYFVRKPKRNKFKHHQSLNMIKIGRKILAFFSET